MGFFVFQLALLASIQGNSCIQCRQLSLSKRIGYTKDVSLFSDKIKPLLGN